jgi:chemotaxis methyl-accepting protein methylase
MNNELILSLQSFFGLDISKYDISFLKQVVEKRLAITETKNFSDYIQYLSNNATEAATLFQSFNITYTEFFRNPLTFAHLEQWILPRLMEEKSDNNELRIWSAGCSSGQEVYSIAMLIESINSKKQIKKRYRIIATDISESVLHEAIKGEYNEKDIQMIRVKDLKDFFVKSGEKYIVCDRLKQHVSFSVYDLLDNRSACPQESIFGNFDLVVCSNMLFYYKPVYQHSIVKKLIYSMDEQGYLITGEAEMQIVAKFKGLCLVVPPSPIFKQRRGAR